jgi:hypothetical protein
MGEYIWLLEVALIVLLAATLFHAVRLERALGVLKRDRSTLERLVNGFNASTRQAQAGVDQLRATADSAGRQIARQIETGMMLKDDLTFLIERSERAADRLDALVRHARPPLLEATGQDLGQAALGPSVVSGLGARLASIGAAVTAPLPSPPSGTSPVGPMPAGTSPAGTSPAGASPPSGFPPRAAPYALPGPPRAHAEPETDMPRLRSQAERDLMKALRLAR